MGRVLAVLLGCVWLAGCDNSCQTLCVQMADYSDECGRTVSASEVATCIEDFDDATSDELKVCRDYGAPDVVRRQWTCDDLNLYRDVSE